MKLYNTKYTHSVQFNGSGGAYFLKLYVKLRIYILFIHIMLNVVKLLNTIILVTHNVKVVPEI